MHMGNLDVPGPAPLSGVPRAACELPESPLIGQAPFKTLILSGVTVYNKPPTPR
jgi:hypothetical protein